MGSSFGSLRELLARQLVDAHAILAAMGDQAGQTWVVALTGRQNAIEAPLAGLQRFLNRVQAVKNFHEI
jgi:hypothetical protein